MKTISSARAFLFGALLSCASGLQAADWYVATTGNDTTGSGTLASPFKTIQKGVNTAADGDTVLVLPGLYATGENTSTPAAGKSRVVIAKNVTVRSTAGAAQTVIRGQYNSTTAPFGPASVRCVFMTAGTLEGFTLEWGFADASSNPPAYQRDNPLLNGGGVCVPGCSYTPQINNCIITSCAAYRGGGAYWGTLNNCTVVSNLVLTTSGDGVWGSLVRNSIVFDNGNENYSSAANSEDPTFFEYSCTTPAPGLNYYGVSRDGGHNVTSAPLFQAASFLLSTNSPCINVGNNDYASGAIDAAGNPRIYGGVVDMGAYESTFALFPLTVVNGTGSGNYFAGAVVPIAATNPPAWATFSGWTGDVAVVSNVLSTSTTVTMPPSPVTVVATYHFLSLPEIVGGILDIPQPVTLSNVTLAAVSTVPPEVRLGPVADGDLAAIGTVYTNAGTLIFPWRVSCEPVYDRLALFIDGVERASITGEASGVVTQFVAGAGAHTVQWMYIKDGSEYNGADCGWLGEVTWIPDALAAELGVAGKPIGFPYGRPGEPLPFPYGFAGCFLDTACPSGAVGAAAVKLGGATNGVPIVANGKTNGTEVVLNGAGQLSFSWYAATQAGDPLICFIDGKEAARISGDSSKSGGWRTFTTNLLVVGAHTVRWAYAKDAAGQSTLDCAWVDNVTWTQFAFVLTVENGTGNGVAVSTNAVGDTIALAASPAPAGSVFDTWDGDTETVADLAAPDTSLVMPGRDLTVRALYKVQTLTLTVVNGRDAGAWPNEVHESTGEPEGSYPPGALVRIVADPAPLWQTFSHWTNSVPVVFSNAFADVSMFVMPTSSVAITAVYRPQTEAEKLAGALTIRGQPLAITAFSPSGVVAEATGGIRYDDPVVKLGGPSVGPNQSVSLTTTNFVGDGILMFWWHADAEKDFDGVQVLVNGTPTPLFCSTKDTNRWDNTEIWTLSYVRVTGADEITFRFVRDDTYYVHDNMVELDRVMWLPQAMVDALDVGACIPNINHEYDPLFQGRVLGRGEAYSWEGEDGGVTWVGDAPGGVEALRLGAFGYVTNGLLAQVAFTNFGTGVLTWDWTARSEASFDCLEFLLDGARTNWISGKDIPGWFTSGFLLANDTAKDREENRGLKRIFTFRYKKDADVSVFEDCGWLRNVTWMPTFLLQVAGGTNTAFVLPPPYDLYPGVAAEAEKNIFPAGTQITIQADPPQTGYYFDRWVGDGADALLGAAVINPNATFSMPGFDLSLTATYTDVMPPTTNYALTVVEGSGSGNYPNGTVVAIAARTPGMWETFTGWTGDVGTVADTSASNTTVTVGTSNILVTATFSSAPIEEIIQTVLDLPNPVIASGVGAGNIVAAPPAVRLGPVANSSTAFFETTFEDDGTLIFPWSVDSEEGYDVLTFTVDGVPIASISGQRSAVVTNFIAGSGTHTLRWAYTKDGSDAAGQDAGTVLGPILWIPNALSAEFGVPGKPLHLPYGLDSVVLDPAPPAGAISNLAAKLGAPAPVADGAETSVEAYYYGAGLLSFQWRVSSELNHDFLTLTIDGQEAARISGTKGGWVLFQTNLLNVATHAVRWVYSKDSSGAAGSDCGWVDSVTWQQFAFLLTVENGTGSGTNAVGATVSITANPAPAGMEFNCWDGDAENITDPTSPSTTLIMPGRDITVRAIYKPQTLDVTVINGRDAGAWPNEAHESTGEPEGSYPEGALVRIVADDAPLWQAFAGWIADPPVVFSNALSEVSMFVMPSNDVTVTATYRPQTEAEKLADALTIKGQPLEISTFSPSGVVAEATGGIRYNDSVVQFGGAAVGAGQSVYLTITNFTGDGVLLFWASASSETAYDRIQVLNGASVIHDMVSPKCGKWHASTNYVWGATSLTLRFMRDSSYFVRDNTILIDRVIWIPIELIDAVGFPYTLNPPVPNINAESSGFDGEDGGVSWDSAAPGGAAIRFGRFGFVNNSQHAQLVATNASTGVLTWEWATSSEFNYDQLEFFFDGKQPDPLKRISGKAATWYPGYFVVSNLYDKTREDNINLRHTFRFDYSKDEDVSVFRDCAWLRGGVWTPSSMLFLMSATYTYTLNAPFNGMPEAVAEAHAGVYPAGTTIDLVSEPPPSGWYFDRWAGSTGALAPGDITQPACTFGMPGYDTVLVATYTTNAPSPSSTLTKAHITKLEMTPSAEGPALSGKTQPGMTVALSFDGAVQTDYDVLFSPALVGPDCVWQTLPVRYSEALGDTAEGGRQLRVFVEAPADAPQGFFRVQPK